MLHTESILPTHQGIYTPLSQAMSDSESDEEIEIHNASKHRQQQQQQQQLQQQQQQQRNRSRLPPNTLALKSPHTGIKKQQQQQLNHSNNINNMQNTFRSVMLSDLGRNNTGSNVAVEFSHFNGDYDANADNVAILGNQHTDTEDTKHSLPMSTQRRCCFIASLLLCLLAVVGFVWLIPCGNADGTGACPAPVDRIRTHNWLNNYTKIELRGGVNIVAGLRAWENNLVFLYRGDVFFPEFRASNHKRNGIISLLGSSGAVAWYDETVDEPLAIDCSLLDVDGNGKPDCLVIEEYGELGVINSASGQWHWRYVEHAARKLNAHDLPLIVPDLDGDNVLDILFISSIKQPGSTGARNVLRLLSGRQGLPIGDGFQVHDCAQLTRLQLDSTMSYVSYSCGSSNKTELQRSKSLAELYRLMTNKSMVGRHLLPASKMAQQRRRQETERHVYTLSGRELLVENRGKCPDCQVTLVLTESRNGKRHTLRNFTNNGMYGMEPAQWSFKNTKSQMSGYVMKFWKWPTSSNKLSNYTNSSSSKEKDKEKTKDKDKDKFYSKKKQQQQQQQRLLLSHEFPANERQEFDHLEHLLPIQKRDAFAVPAKNRSKAASSTTAGHLLNNYRMQMITETVILVLFIGADTRIENISQSNIVQFCRHNERLELITCQPDLCNQENSLLIADLDMDGSQELVSYMSTFVPADELQQQQQQQNNWKLISYVRLLRLQSELPAYYDQEKHN
ncbi:hypothetical protein ACLKA7_017459 [Drosophila subpalustris]